MSTFMIRTMVLLALVLTVAGMAPAQEETAQSKFKDPEDGALDLSSFLLSPAGFMPFPIIITEPAVGYGGGLALAFFHADKKAYEEKQRSGDTEFGPLPSISVGAGAYTENGTWFAGGGHLGVWKDDTIRYTGFVGLMNANLKFYVRDRPLEFNIDGGFLYQDVKFRIADSDLFVGAGYTFFSSESTFDLSDIVEGIDPIEVDSRNAGLAAEAFWDSRDNIFTPNQGVESELKLTRFDEALGGDFGYWHTKFKLRSYHQLHERFVLGLRLDGDYTSGDPPFYALPFVDLRGIPAMRYQNDWVAEVEAEGRWNVTKRWSLVGFLGKGWTGGDRPTKDTDDNIFAGGVGFRYLIARVFGMHVGIDVARGPEDTAIYLISGRAW